MRKKPPDPSNARSMNEVSRTSRHRHRCYPNYNRSNETPPTADDPVRPGGGARTLADRHGAAVRRTPPAARGGAARGGAAAQGGVAAVRRISTVVRAGSLNMARAIIAAVGSVPCVRSGSGFSDTAAVGET